MHAPHDAEGLARARRRFVYQELLVLQIALAMRRYLLTRRKSAPPLVVNETIDRRIVRLFPWELTADQRRAIDEVCRDMAQPFPMNRLLQGDVASGKTVVAIYAMLLAVAHKHQAALMAPTEILARQHAETLAEQLRESRVRIGLLTGTLPAAERRRMLEEIAAGRIDLVVGTHAIVQDDVQFAKLGLVIVDEQHKFGVRQRATLKHSGTDPHYLVMTATPIPRTMSMTLFGDLEVSTLREGPPGRQKVRTYIADADKRDQWWEFFRKKLREGRQGYVIAPLVDESETVDAASVEQLLESLLDGPLDAFRLDLLHGRMSAAEKERAMRAFRSGETQVLVATPVVEVGIDVPNATLMTIEGGERFGLSQLHQLRGRISRGSHAGHLCVFAEPTSEESQKRLAALAETTDGFKLAEVDFALRGPGDLFSARQHGLPPLRVADLVADREIVAEARRDAQALIENDPELAAPAYARLRKMVLVRYGKAMELGDVG
jgi:ATP-dependent DNA helicase RecG